MLVYYFSESMVALFISPFIICAEFSLVFFLLINLLMDVYISSRLFLSIQRKKIME